MKLKIFQIIFLTTVLLSGFLMPYSVDANSGYDFELKYWNNGTVDIIGYNGSESNLVIPSRYQGYDVVGIGASAFSSCYSLQSVSIPDSVTSIGSSAFTFCYSLQSVSIPDSVTSIGSYAFYGCSSLQSVSIPDSVTSIGSYAFYNCKKLKEVNYNAVNLSDFSYETDVFYNAGVDAEGITVTFGNSVKKIPAYLFYVSNSSYSPNVCSVSISNSVTSIGSSAFFGCSSLQSVSIPDSVTSIESYAFCRCSSLQSVSIPDSVTSIGSSAFSGCSSLQSVSIPDSVTSIGSSAFYGCSSLQSVSIPDSVTSIGSSAFYNCKKLKEVNYNAVNLSDFSYETDVFYNAGVDGEGITVTFGNSVKKIPAYLFYASYSSYFPNVCSVSISNSVTSIGSYAFYGCSSLQSVSIPDSVTYIGSYAFCGCSSLQSISIPDSVTSIGSYAFANSCITQTKLTLPKTLESIGEGAFSGWSSLKEITMPFVGAERGISGTKDAVFGHIFGITDYTENSTFQTFSMDGMSYQIPNTLRKVTVTDETVIPYGAFSGCGFLTDIVIEGSPSTIMSHAFSDYYNLFNVYVKSKTVKYSDTAFKYSEFPTLYGFTGSTTETFANDNSFVFVSIDDTEAETYNISAKAQVIENNIVFNVKTDKTIYDKMVHIAIYDDTQSLSDYIIIPNYDSFNEVNVVFKNRSDISFAKVFLWESPTSITPITEALRININ